MSGRRLAIPQQIQHPIYKGYVNKQGGNHKSWKTRYAVLYPQLMVYYEHSGLYEFDVKRGSLENRKNHVILQGAQVVSSRSRDEKLQFAFTIIVTATDNKRNTYVIANSSYSERELWMEKVNDAINGGSVPEITPPTPITANPRFKLVTKQSTLRLLDSNTADSVRNAMVDRDSESDIDDTDSENENEPRRRTAKSHAGKVQKSYSQAVPELSTVPQDTSLSTTESNKPRPMLTKDALTINSALMIKEECGKSVDDYNLKPGGPTGLHPNSSNLNSIASTEEIVVTYASSTTAPKVMLGKEGFMYKQGGKHKNWKHRYLIAVPGRLAYYKSKPSSPGDKSMGIVKLKNITCSAKPGIPKFPHLFEITSNSQWNKRGTYVFSATSSEERAEWMEALMVLGGDCKAQIEELTEMHETSRMGAEKRAISFSDAVTQSIDEDDYLPKLKTPEDEKEGSVPEGANCDIDNIPEDKPSTTKTKRHVEGEYDLDISFITSNILVMSFPYSKEEIANFQTKGRNDIDIVEKFLNEKYKKSYRVYNLCKEMSYADTRFNGNIGMYPFEDHCAPPLILIHKFIEDMHNWLVDNSNVAVIHCNSGKGRSGCMIASYLIYAKEMFYNEAVEQFNINRINFGRGLSVPSHLRYVKYVDRIRLNPAVCSFEKSEERTIECIQIHMPIDAGVDWKPFVTVVSVESNLELFNSVKDGETTKNMKSNMITVRKIDLKIKNDIQVNIWDYDDAHNVNLSLDAYLFIHSSFITDKIMLFKKPDLDKLYKTKLQDFSVSVQFAPISP